MIAIIAAMAKNRVIGCKGQIPWNIKEDIVRFKALTSYHSVVMGRLTHQSIGRILPNRINCLITRNPDHWSGNKELKVFPSVEKAINILTDAYEYSLPAVFKGIDIPEYKIFIIGGAQIYQESIPYATHLYLTNIDAEYEGDVVFPDIDLSGWRLIETSRKLVLDKKSGNKVHIEFNDYGRI